MRAKRRKIGTALVLLFPIAVFSCKDQGILYPDFGTLHYRFITDSLRPVIRNDTLVALIGYSGCKDNKPLEIQYVILHSGDCAMWLHCPGNYIEPCLAYFTQWVNLKVPSRVLESPRITLMTPYNGDIDLK